jgi:benzodiazapine receptor
MDTLTPAGTAASFYSICPLAGALMVPTQIWVTIAAKLNYDIVRLNTSGDKQA